MTETESIEVRKAFLIDVDCLLSRLLDNDKAIQSISGFYVIECLHIKSKLKDLIEGRKVL